MYSGKNGKQLYNLTGDKNDDEFGFAVRGVGDLNGDGYADFAVGAPQMKTGAGYVRFFSGRTGKALGTFPGLTVGDAMGYAIADAGDVNGDKVPDVVVAAPQVPGLGRGYVGLLSGKDARVLQVWVGTTTGDMLGYSVSRGVDLDGDGSNELILGSPGNDTKALDAGAAWRVSTKDGKVLSRLYGDAKGDRFGASVAIAGDVDKDGRIDFLVGAPNDDNRGTDSGSARVYSGRDNALLRSHDGAAASFEFGRSACGLGDVDGDGYADYAVGSPKYGSSTVFNLGRAYVFSGRKRPFATDVYELSMTSGGTQHLQLDAGPSHAGRNYWILGSFTGTQPGFKIGNVTVPLVVDPYTSVTITSANSQPFSGFRGVLDSAGKATAAINVPPLANLAPFTLYHAFVVYDATGTLHFASNPVVLGLVK